MDLFFSLQCSQLAFIPLVDVLSGFKYYNDFDFENEITLPQYIVYIRCVSHTLNLIAVHDTE